jgi:hypothetical protein
LNALTTGAGHTGAHNPVIVTLDDWSDDYNADLYEAQRRKKSELSSERKTRLDELGFFWEKMSDFNWSKNLNALMKFKEREGHCRVPQGHMEGNLRLGNWVSTQRQSKNDKLSEDRLQRLDEVGFVWEVK